MIKIKGAKTQINSARPPVKREKLQKIASQMLKELGCDLNDPNLRDSPRRIADSWIELTAGMDANGIQKIRTTFPKACTLAGACHNLISLKGPFTSLCAHHFLAFRGWYVLSYIPEDRIIGASKVQRIFDLFGRKPQSQEMLAHEVAHIFTDIVQPRGVAVWCGGVHDCMVLRGVETRGTWMENRHLQGEFNADSRLQTEFSALVAYGRPSSE